MLEERAGGFVFLQLGLNRIVLILRNEIGRSKEVTMRILILTLVAIFGMTTITSAQKPEKLTLGYGKQKVAGSSGLTVKFVSVVEDSRCPVGVNCIWAGNARITVKVTDGRSSKLMTMNTGAGPQGDQMSGWAVRLVALTPEPTDKGKSADIRYVATFTIERLTR